MMAWEPHSVKPGQVWLFDDGISRILLMPLGLIQKFGRYQTWECSAVGIPAAYHTAHRFDLTNWDFPSSHTRLLVDNG